MRGYVSFLLVLASLSLILYSAAALSATHGHSHSKAIALQRTGYLSMNVKESLSEAVSYGLKEGALLYDAATPPEERTPQGREAALRAAAFASLSIFPLHSFDDDFEVELWCAYATESELSALPKEMREKGAALAPSASNPLSSPLCAEFIQIVQEPGRDYAYLKGPLPPAPIAQGIVGISIYSSKFDIAQVSYFPSSEEIA